MYKIRAITARPDGQVLPLHRSALTYFSGAGDDVYCHLEVGVDVKKTVKPVEVRAKPEPSKVATEIAADDKFITVAKYSYYESGSKYVKVLLDFFKDIKGHPRDKISCDFSKRALTLRVLDYKGHHYQFQVPRLQCHIVPEECSFTVKSDSILITLRKAKDDDNWYSLFKSKAIGEVESD